MNQMNQIIFEGTVVNDPEVKQSASGTYVSTITAANERYYKTSDGETVKEVAYFDIEAYGEQFANMCEQKAKKGTEIRVVGRLKQSKWTNGEGKKCSKVYIIAEHIDFMETNKEEEKCL